MKRAKLTEQAPRFASESGRHGQALSFLCPHCNDRRIVVPFENPLDGKAPMGALTWQREGASFGEISLTPSVSVPGHWHGFVTRGELVTP